MAETVFFKLSDDVVLNIFFKLQEDPRNWARLACVCVKFSSLIRTVCWKQKCSKTIPSVISDLLFCISAPPGCWSALYKLAVCCPGLRLSGVLLNNSDFGPSHYRQLGSSETTRKTTGKPPSSSLFDANSEVCVSGSGCSWSLYDDLYYNASETQEHSQIDEEKEGALSHEHSACKRRKVCRSIKSHLASGVWNLSREQGNKLLHSRFRGDCLYLCDWPGCVHIEEKRNYMLFRGIFKDFKRTQVWRTIKDGNRNKIDLNCAFCSCNDTWDLHSAFCLRRFYGYHDDGEPIVRAYVCENGHVSGTWTHLPLYT